MFLFSHIYAYALPAHCGVALRKKSVAAGSATWRRHAQNALHKVNLTNSLAHIWHRGGGGEAWRRGKHVSGISSKKEKAWQSCREEKGGR